MYYTTTKGKTDKNLIIIKAPIRDMGNRWIFGVKFCQSYGIVEKDSKIYYQITRSPLFKGFKELPLSFLQKVFRSKDIELIFGREIFLSYLDAVNLTSSQVKNRIGDDKIAIRKPIDNQIKECGFTKVDGTICKNKPSPASPLGYCFGHLRHDKTK